MAKSTDEILAEQEDDGKEFLDTLSRIDDLPWEAERMLREVIRASKVEASLKDGTIGGGAVTLVLSPEVNAKGVVQLKYKLTSKLPTKKRAATTFFVGKGGRLQSTPEMHQEDLFDKDARVLAEAEDEKLN
jgi:hypothetical protein